MHTLSLFNPELAPDSVTIPAVVESYLAYLAARRDAGTHSKAHYANVERYLRQFARFLPVPIEDARQKDFAAWLDSHANWSGHTKKGVQSRVIECFAWAADPNRGDLIQRSPFARIPSVTNIPYTPRRAAQHHEYEALMRNGSIQLRQSLFLIQRTGCRPCEMRQLLWRWVKIEEEVPHLALQWHKTFRKTGKVKLIGLDEACVRFLRVLKSKRPMIGGACRCDLSEHVPHDLTEHVFFNCDGAAWSKNVFAQNLRRVAARSGLDEGVERRVSAGCFRTSYTCDLIKLGFTNREIADMLGHETTEMVDTIYGAETRRQAEHLASVAKRAAEARNRKK